MSLEEEEIEDIEEIEENIESLANTDATIPCPVCHLDYDICDIFVHVFTNHPTFLLVWRSVHCPLMPNMIYDYEIAYEPISTDESYINHLEAPLTQLYGEAASQFICPICFESPHSMMSHRKITKCGHVFCSQCIDTWFQINMTCPMCRVC
jgi:hypothetical protein